MASSLLDRFIKYVKIDTQSDPNSLTTPSTEKQKNLGKELVKELRELGILDAHLDKWGYLYATIPSNSMNTNVPTICFCSHMDTSPDSSGTNVKPLIHRNYQGQKITLPDDPTQIISPIDHPHLLDQIGNDIITASGTTLLGADNKSGIAAIMHAAQNLMQNPAIKHGKIRILFTPDEEIGRGVDKVDIKKLNADFGYTVDGEQLGSLEDETFSADAATIQINGVSAHPGFGLNKLENATKIGADILANLPQKRLSPETTSKRQGFIHPVSFEGKAESATIKVIIRDFDTKKLKKHAQILQNSINKALKKYPNSSAELIITEQYRNMKDVLKKHPKIVKTAIQAMKDVGLEPKKGSIRGGTDGSRLSFIGLPCPNIFAGEHAFHSKHEWVSLQDMHKSSKVIVRIAQLFEKKSK